MAKKQQIKEDNKLTKLVEQASLTINMAEPDDLADMQNLQNILNEIEKNIETITQAPTQLLEQAKGTTSEEYLSCQRGNSPESSPEKTSSLTS